MGMTENLLGKWLGAQALSLKEEEEWLLTLGERTKARGVYLTAAEAREVAQSHRDSLKRARRLEFDRGPVEKLALAFCGSIHISREEWAQALERLTDLFYQTKNDTWDRVGDDALIAFMAEGFEGCCCGSFDLLESEVLPELGRFIRGGGSPDAFVLPERTDRWES